jgi:general secretion pathway protein K
MTRPPKDQGTALMAALLLVALMATVSLQLVDMSRFAVFRTGHIDTRASNYWQALGAREFAESVIQRSLNEAVMRSDLAWLNEPQVFATDDGLVTGQITDSNNCLNINAMVEQSGEDVDLETTGDAQRARERFDRLMIHIGAPPGQMRSLSMQIIDWIDADTRPEPGGAEDQTYEGFEPAYRTANRPMAQLDELMALPDMTPSLYATLEPWLCALPIRTQPPLNLNTLRLDQAPLLAAVFSEGMTLADAEAVLFRRPPQGYDAVEAFFADPIIEPLEPDAVDQASVTLRSQWFAMSVTLRTQEARFTLSQLTEFGDNQQVTRHQQRFGAL